VAVGAAVAALAVSFLVVGVSRSWVVFAVAQTLFAFTPDALVTVGIQRLGDAAQPLLVVLAAAVSVAVFAGLTLATLAVAAAAERERAETVFAVGVVVTVAGFLLTVAPVAALAGGVAAGLVVGLAGVESASDSPTRRRLLRSLGTAVVALGVGSTVGGYRLAAAGTAADDERGRRETTDPVVRELLAAAERRSLDVPGVEGLVSTDFYRVDINTVDPRVDPDDWSLTVTDTTTEGTELTVSLSELRAYEAQHRFVSLRCVGDKLNGEKLDTALWTGVPVRTLLADANTERTENCCVYVRAADDYYQEFPLSALSDAILVYGMNGGPLPRGHGAPVRLLVPGHWGEINVKWITAIELRDEPARGYWEKRGWHGTGPVNTVAKLHGVETDDGTVTVGGHAYAGTRGIDRVEVSTDDGETWT
ncbi:MAG: molybdopterin-dependent oxidoreductase, partial [Halobaculum sp.]